MQKKYLYTIIAIAVIVFAMIFTYYFKKSNNFILTKNGNNMNVLNKVNYPKDLKNLSINDLNSLADEMREIIIKKVNATGAHMGPNLGFLEPTIALHYVFDAPEDKIVYDVSHQSYPHKILTGRKDGFIDESKYYKYTGYTAPEESEYDLFKVGHTSTSIALATGMAKARDIEGKKENVVAVIGDGSLTGGEALEGLNNASVLNSNIIIVVNDNGMSIAENQGGLHQHLQELKKNKGNLQNNMFKALGFDYVYVDEGNNVEKLIEAFKKVKDINHPVIVHLNTEKGHGLPEAVANKEKFHYTMPHVLDNKSDNSGLKFESYASITNDYLLDKVKAGENIIVVSPATPGATGLTPDVREQFGKNYLDTGIAEQYAVGFISGAAKNGAKPVLQIISSFIQRTYDQLSQDLALNNSPAVILVYAGSIYGMGDATHLGIFDIPLISNIPNIVYLAPTNREEHLAMLDWAVKQNNHSVVIRVPVGDLISTGVKDNTDYSKLNKFKLAEKGQDVAIIGVGNFFELAKDVKEELKKEGINATLINPVFISGIDEEMLEDLKKNHKVVITLEDGIVEGGFGQKIASYYGNSDMKVLNFGATKEFTDRLTADELTKKHRLSKETIADDVIKMLK